MVWLSCSWPSTIYVCFILFWLWIWMSRRLMCVCWDLAYMWKDEEMKVKEDERWFKAGKISWGSSFHLSGSIKECVCSCLAGVNWPLLSGASGRAAAPHADASNRCQLDALWSILSDSNVSQMFGRWEYGNGGTTQWGGREMVERKARKIMEPWRRQKTSHTELKRGLTCLLSITEGQIIWKKLVFSTVIQADTFSLSEELSMCHVSSGCDCQSLPSGTAHTHTHTVLLLFCPSLHMWRICICHTFFYPFIKAWISVRASVNIHFLKSFFSFSIALDPFPGSKPSLHPFTSSVYLSPSSVFRPTFNLIVEKTTSVSLTSSWTFTGEKKSSFCEFTWWRWWTSEDTQRCLTLLLLCCQTDQRLSHSWVTIGSGNLMPVTFL